MTKKTTNEGIESQPNKETIDLQSEIDRQIGPLVPQGARKQVVERVSKITAMQISEHFSGPIPHPKHLEHYEEICPGSADRIISMAENQLAHNQRMDTSMLKSDSDYRKLGLLAGWAIFAMLIICALIIALNTDNSVIVGIFLSAATLSGVAAFINGKK